MNLSPTTQALLQHNTSEIAVSEVLCWLQSPPSDRSQQLDYEQACLCLLCDIEQHLLETYPLKSMRIPKKTNTTVPTYALFILLGMAGALMAICDGFDGVASILSLFIGIPVWFVYVVGFSFSLLSLTVFYGFDFIQIAQNLDINLLDEPRLLDVLIEQTIQVKHIRKLLQQLKEENIQGDDFVQLVEILNITHCKLRSCGEQYKQQLERSELSALKTLVALTAGVLFFSYGFFSGQSLAVAVLSLYLSAVSLLFWPVMAMSILVGLASFGVYWFVERPGLENLVSSWLGLDRDKIEQLTNEHSIDKTNRKLAQLHQFFASIRPQEECSGERSLQIS